MFWLIAVLMTLAAIAAAIWPFIKREQPEEEASTTIGARQVFIDQLEEIKHDQERGLLNETEFESARAEIARRLLALEREDETRAQTRASRSGSYAWLAILVIPIATIGLYLHFGSPQLPDQPIAERLNQPDEQQDINVLIARIEKHLENEPDDIRGWQTLIPIYERLGRHDKLEKALTRLLDIGLNDDVATGQTQNRLAQLLTMNEGGRVITRARELFEQGRKNAPNDPVGHFFEAVALTQNDKRDEAIVAWEALIERFGKNGDPPWLTIARQSLAALKGQPAEGTSPDGSDQVVSEDQSEFIESMVQSLAARLEDEPNDLQGWRRLVRSYMVLERPADAKAALTKARTLLSDNQDALNELDIIAKEHELQDE